MTQFIVGKKYSARSACDHNCIWIFEVVKRTKCFVWLKEDGHDEARRRKVSDWEGVESCSPDGKYSMSPVLRAERVVEEDKEPEGIVEIEEKVIINHIGNGKVNASGAADDYAPVEKKKSRESSRETLVITAKETEVDTLDGMVHKFSRSKIDYEIFIHKDNISVYKANNQRGGKLTLDCYRGGVSDKGKPMSKMLNNTIGLIMTQFVQQDSLHAC